jgi:hypothetical protein
MICHYCGRTWHIRLCPRGHENPYNAQYCGTCGSVDLTETAGRRPWFLIALKGFLWILVGLLVYSLVVGFPRYLKTSADHFLSLIFIICLLLFGWWFSLSLLPRPIGNTARRMGKYILKLVVSVARSVLKAIWEIMR